MLHLANARYALDDGYPQLIVEIEGRTAHIEPPRHPAFHDAGLVMLNEDFEGVIPPKTLRPYGGPEQTFEGLADDARLFRLVDAFADACERDDFAAGPVPIPA